MICEAACAALIHETWLDVAPFALPVAVVAAACAFLIEGGRE